jgi:predicted nucleotidyltransferase component of viral defense system
MDFMYKLEQALTLLNTKLANKNIVFDITVLGSMALYLTGFNIQRKTDLDICNENIKEEIKLFIIEVSQELGLAKDWINNRASSIKPLPSEFEYRLIHINKYSHINIKVFSKEDLIKLKVNALYSRDETKDLEDLKSLQPTANQLDDAISYIKEQIIYHHGKLELSKKNNELNLFRKELDETLR